MTIKKEIALSEHIQNKLKRYIIACIADIFNIFDYIEQQQDKHYKGK